MQYNTEKPLVSIAMLTWNRANDLEKSVLSLLNQTYQNFELIINDDNSTDDTELISAKLMALDRRVKYFKNKKNLKYSGNSNIAIERATSEYVAIVHDGDLYDTTLIEKWIGLLLKYNSASLAFCGTKMMDDNWKPQKIWLHGFPEIIKGEIISNIILNTWGSPIWGIVMVRKSKILELGMFDNNFPRLTDVDMWIRLLLKYDAVYVNEALLEIAPREKDHENKGVNWKIVNELSMIIITNINRRFPNETIEKKNILKTYKIKYCKAHLISFYNCLKHRKYDLAEEGLMVFNQNNLKLLNVFQPFLRFLFLTSKLLRP